MKTGRSIALAAKVLVITGGPGVGKTTLANSLLKILLAKAVVIVLFLLLGGGFLASRQLYFIGTNAQGIVTVYRGLPYDLPAGIHLYETFYVSGVPTAMVPSDRRKSLFDHKLRSQSDASSLIRDLELGKVQ